MDIDVIVTKKAVYWGWGTGGIRVVELSSGNYVPEPISPVTPGLMNNPQPLFANLVIREHDCPRTYTGWVEKSIPCPQKRKRPKPFMLDYAFFFLKRFDGDTISMNAQEVQSMRNAWKSFHEMPDYGAEPMLISELALYDEDMNHIHTENVCMPVNVGDSFEFIFYNRR
ncbi:MAG: hypothetical protein P4L77_11775 [Sulfuriferula sp.]|nr:hypothetical protein [Sulfuriferula sp.]